jgi:hypothetical protein
MADMHPLVVLAQRLAEGRRQHPSNAAFGQWVKDNGLGHLTHRDRVALLRIATLDPQEASTLIRRSSYTTPEHLWYRALSRLAVRKTTSVAVRKTEPEPEGEVDYADKVEEFLERLRLAHGDDAPEDWYQFFDEHVIHIAAMLLGISDDPPMVFGVWLDSQTLFDLDDDDRDFLVELIGKHHDTWFEIVQRMRKTSGQ